MEGKIKLAYSVDQASTWKDAVSFGASSTDIDCTLVRVHIDPEPQQEEDAKSGSAGVICYQGDARLRVYIKVKSDQINVGTTKGQQRYKFLGSLRCAPLIRLVAASIDGFTEWSGSTNTLYLVPGDCPPVSWESIGDKAAQMHINLRCKTEYTL